MLRPLLRYSISTASHFTPKNIKLLRPTGPALANTSYRYLHATRNSLSTMSSDKADPKSEVLSAEQANPAASPKAAAAGEEGEGEGKTSKSAGELRITGNSQVKLMEIAKKAAKAAEKQAKQAARGGAPTKTWGEPKKDKKEKAKIEGVSVTEWVNPTPVGEKKGKLSHIRSSAMS
jgi:hypothetical protein